MTGPGGTNVSQACAACKHQRRKCAPDCALAPYFPPHRQTEFLNVHRLFGVRNVMNTVKNVDPNLRENAVRSMIDEANLRVLDPVSGSCGIVMNYQNMCNQIKFELDLVRQQVAICRAAADGENGEIQSKVRSFYDDIMAQRYGKVPLQCQPVDKASEKASTSGKDDVVVKALQIEPCEDNGAKKMSNIDINDKSPDEMEENELDKPAPEDVKQHSHG